jgi:hypothetical protein
LLHRLLSHEQRRMLSCSQLDGIELQRRMSIDRAAPVGKARV